MRPDDHLLNKFEVSKETRDLADDLVRQAKLKTGPGSGRELGEFRTGLPAVCVLLASERLNTNEVSLHSAQVASCLKKKDFKRVYDNVRAAVEDFEKEQESKSTYAELHEQYNTSGVLEEKLKPYFIEVENELMTLATGYGHGSPMFRCLVYFWICGAALKLKSIPPTDVFAYEHELHPRKFIDILHLLNMRKSDLRDEIQKMFSKSRTSPSKQSASAATTPRQSPRKATTSAAAVNLPESPSKTASTRSQIVEKQRQAEPQTPRRSQRTLILQEGTLSKATPTKRTPQTFTSPVKIAQPPPPRLRFPNKVPLRELPSKDTPKKRTVETLQEQGDEMASPEEPPVKRARTTVEESPSKRTTRSASASAAAATSQKAKAEAAAIEAVEAVEAAVLKSPRKRKGGQVPSVSLEQSNPSKVASTTREDEVADEVALVNSVSSDDESESEVSMTRRRFRPVYLELRQWNSRDPRLSKIWKKAEKRFNAAMQAA